MYSYNLNFIYNHKIQLPCDSSEIFLAPSMLMTMVGHQHRCSQSFQRISLRFKHGIQKNDDKSK